MSVNEHLSFEIKERYCNREIKGTKSKRTRATINIFNCKVCWGQSNEAHDSYNKLFGAFAPDSIRAYALGGPVSRSSPRPQIPSVPRPPTPSLLPTEANTVDDVSVDHKNGVLNAKPAEASKQAPSILVNGRKRKHTKGTEDKTQETSTSQTNRNENQSEPKDQSDKPQNLSATTRDEEKHETTECKSSPKDREVRKISLFGAPNETTKDQ